MIDVTDIPGVEEGDEVVIFSAVPGNTPEDMARVLDTIPYEVMTSVSGRETDLQQRVKRESRRSRMPGRWQRRGFR